MRCRCRAALVPLVAVTAWLSFAVPAPASRTRTTITEHVDAALSGVRRPGRTRLRIELDGRTVYHRLVRSPFCGADCSVTPVPPRQNDLRVVDLSSDGRPDVVLGLYSGGAHCCFIDQVFSRVGAGDRFVKAEYNFLDTDPRLERLDRRWVLIGPNAELAEEYFTDFAHSGAPIRVLHFSGRRFVDITRSFPALIRHDAARWMRLFRRHRADDVGYIAAWAADQDMLGHRRLVRSTLAADARRGILHSSLPLPHGGQRAFVVELQRDLRKLGYAT